MDFMGLYVANYVLLVVTFGFFVMVEFYCSNKQYSKMKKCGLVGTILLGLSIVTTCLLNGIIG